MAFLWRQGNKDLAKIEIYTHYISDMSQLVRAFFAGQAAYILPSTFPLKEKTIGQLRDI